MHTGTLRIDRPGGSRGIRRSRGVRCRFHRNLIPFFHSRLEATERETGRREAVGIPGWVDRAGGDREGRLFLQKKAPEFPALRGTGNPAPSILPVGDDVSFGVVFRNFSFGYALVAGRDALDMTVAEDHVGPSGMYGVDQSVASEGGTGAI